jgi:hypothetical protein
MLDIHHTYTSMMDSVHPAAVVVTVDVAANAGVCVNAWLGGGGGSRWLGACVTLVDIVAVAVVAVVVVPSYNAEGAVVVADAVDADTSGLSIGLWSTMRAFILISFMRATQEESNIQQFIKATWRKSSLTVIARLYAH